MKQSGSASEMNKSKIFQNLQGQIDRAERQQAAYKAQYDEAVGIIDKLKPSLMSLFREAGCDQGAGALGAQLREQGPTDVNLLQFLGVIEQRVQEMAQLYKIKHGITLQGGITTDSAPPTPMSKRRHARMRRLGCPPPGTSAPIATATTWILSDKRVPFLSRSLESERKRRWNSRRERDLCHRWGRSECVTLSR